MIPTLQQVFDSARVKLGDNEVSGGQVYTNAYFRNNLLIDDVYQELVSSLAVVDNRLTLAHLHFVLPIHTSYFDPVEAGITNFGEPEAVYERTVRNEYTVTGVTAQTSPSRCRVTITGHDFVTGETGIFYGIGGFSSDINNEWAVTRVDANTVDLNGCRATGTFTSGGTASSSAESWSEPLSGPKRMIVYPVSSKNRLDEYDWLGDRFRFPPASEPRQLKVIHSISGNVPANDTDSTNIDDSLRFLSSKLTEVAALWRGEDNTAEIHAGLAARAREQKIRLGVRTLQRVGDYQTKAFRNQRNTGLPGRFGIW